MSEVVLKKCNSYQDKELDKQIDELLNELGGLSTFVKKGQKVLLKTNLLMGKKPETAVTTNPQLIAALGKKIQALGAEVIIADSPGGPFNGKLLERAYAKSGLTEIATKIILN